MSVSILDLAENAPSAIKAQFKYNTYKSGAEIISLTGISKSYLYIIISGVTGIFKESAYGTVISVSTLSSGDIFGETEIFSPDKKPYSVQTKTECSIILVPKDTVFQWMREVFDFSLFLCETLTRRMCITSDTMSRIALLPIKARVLGCISSHQLDGTLQELTKDELISQVGAPLRSINRVIMECSRAGLIEYKNKRFQVLDSKKLSAFAEVYNI